MKAYPQGKVSSYLHTLQPGDSMRVRGPYTSFSYTPNTYRHISMLAGGTGITPMLQLIRTILSNPQDQTQITLVYANNTEEDILMKDTLDALAKMHENFQVHYVVLNTKNIYWPHYRG
ncbi:hypothetical protein EON63_17350 [archaeon]|nr:MAG: hypothetical protein EON63_17350 [archaeon]